MPILRSRWLIYVHILFQSHELISFASSPPPPDTTPCISSTPTHHFNSAQCEHMTKCKCMCMCVTCDKAVCASQEDNTYHSMPNIMNIIIHVRIYVYICVHMYVCTCTYVIQLVMYRPPKSSACLMMVLVFCSRFTEFQSHCHLTLLCELHL